MKARFYPNVSITEPRNAQRLRYDAELSDIDGWVQIDTIANSHAWGHFEFEGKAGERTISIREGLFWIKINHEDL